MVRSFALAVLVAASGCVVAEEDVAAIESEVVHGEDDRVDVYASTDPVLAQQARDSVVALISHTRLLPRNGGGFDLVGTADLDERLNLCADEPFADQPTVAGCSGTLIDDDLVLTAGHCMIPQGRYGTASCTTVRFVFDFLMESPTTMASIDLDDVYSCRSVVAHFLDDSSDYAVVQLDRPVAGRVPAAVRRVPDGLAIGDEVVEIGFPTGMPMKIDDGGQVLDPGPPSLDYFVASLDAYRGNSGSGVLDSNGAVVGIVARTSEGDYGYDSVDRCYRDSIRPDERGSLASTYVDRALEDLCDRQRYPSARLCGIAPSCGDAFCTSGETSSCVTDCPAPICGDGVCEANDDAASCPYDCGATIVFDGVGCSVAPGRRGSPIAWLVAVVLAYACVRRRHAGLAAAIVGIGLFAGASVADAQPRIHPFGLRFVGTMEIHRDRAKLTNDVEQFGEISERGLGGGLRLGADMGLGRWAGIEATVADHFVGGFESGALDLSLAPRLRLVMRPRHELYLRAPLGVSWQVLSRNSVTASLLVGVGVGYRWQLTRVVDVFVELEFAGRFGGAIDPYDAYALGYALHPSSPPDLNTSSLALRLGIGLGRGYRPNCHAR